ncbi:MAG: hypothetical protein HY000_18385 [Planctomycetes bacterium]|nr:hypothetical protein [Planctomycetota bacterium]
MVDRRFVRTWRIGCVLLAMAAWCCGCAAGTADKGPRPSSTVEEFLQQERLSP